MPFDYKKEYKDLYQPKAKPAIVKVPRMSFVAVEGKGDPNEEGGDYQTTLQLLYGISFTIKMSKMSKNPDDQIDGYFDYVVPPLEGLWWMVDDNAEDGMLPGIDYSRKSDFHWISMIRLPEFVTPDVFEHAREQFAAKHPEADISRAFLFDFDEGTVTQVMHKGPYDDEPATIAALDAYATEQGYALDFGASRYHHEIYLSDPRKSKPENLKTVIRHPVRPADR